MRALRLSLIFFAVALSLKAAEFREVAFGELSLRIPLPEGMIDLTDDDSPKAKMSRGMVVRGNVLAAYLEREVGGGFLKVTMIGDARNNPLVGENFRSFLQQVKQQAHDPEQARSFNEGLKDATKKVERLTAQLLNRQLELANVTKSSVRLSIDNADMFSSLGVARATTMVSGKPAPIVTVISTSVIRVKGRAFVVSNTRPFSEMGDLDSVEKETLEFLKRFAQAND